MALDRAVAEPIQFTVTLDGVPTVPANPVPTISIDHGGFAPCSNAVNSVATGLCWILLDAGEKDCDWFTLRITSDNCDVFQQDYITNEYWTPARATAQDNLDAAVSTRAAATIFAGITSLAHWLRGLYRKSAMDATAKSEVNTGGGAYNETTDSQEAIRDRGDAAWDTAVGFAVAGDEMDLVDAPNATAITAIQDGLLTSGVGENTVTITVQDDDGDPVAQAWVTIKNSTQTVPIASGSTNSNGQMTAGLDDDSYKVIVATQLGYVTSNPYTLTVSGTTALTCEVAAISITAPDDPVYCRVYCYSVEGVGGGFPTGYLRVPQIHSPASSSSKAIVLADSTDRQCALNAAGYAYLDIIKASVVTIELDITGVELETKRRVTIPSTSTANYVDLTES